MRETIGLKEIEETTTADMEIDKITDTEITIEIHQTQARHATTATRRDIRRRCALHQRDRQSRQQKVAQPPQRRSYASHADRKMGQAPPGCARNRGVANCTAT